MRQDVEGSVRLRAVAQHVPQRCKENTKYLKVVSLRAKTRTWGLSNTKHKC